MNEHKNAVHAALVAEHRQLLREHSQLRTLAVNQANERKSLGTFADLLAAILDSLDIGLTNSGMRRLPPVSRSQTRTNPSPWPVAQ
jgi:hypothetical protein